MSEAITITITGGARRRLQKLSDPSQVAEALKREMDKQNQLTVGWIQKQYLSFPQTGPTRPDGLRVISNRLRGSLRASQATFDSQGITSAIGSNVEYAYGHEFCLHQTVNVPSYNRRMKSRDVLNGRKVIAEGFCTVRAHTMKMNFPERRPVRRGISDRAGQYTQAFSAAILNLS